MKVALLLLLTIVITLGLTPAFAGSASDRTLNPEWHKCAKSIGDYGYGAEVFCAKKGIDKYISKKQSTTSASDRTLNPEWHKCAKSIGDYGYGAEVFCAKKGIDKYISKKQSTTSYSVRNSWELSTKSNYAWNNWGNIPTVKSNYASNYGDNFATEKSSFMYKYLNNLGIEKSYTIPEIKPAPQIYKSPEYTKPIQENFGKTIYQDSHISWYNSLESNFGPGISEWPTANTWGNCGWLWCR